MPVSVMERPAVVPSLASTRGTFGFADAAAPRSAERQWTIDSVGAILAHRVTATDNR